MWSYYGAKGLLVDLYPRPKFDKIIEPFAGSAKYSLKYFDRQITLVDKYKTIVDIWHYLQTCSEKDILSLPRHFEYGKYIDDINFDCKEQRDLFAFLCSSGDAVPRNKPTKRKMLFRPNHLNYHIKLVASNLFKIRHWNIIHGTYEDLHPQEATWFIDPPYQYGGQVYKESNKNINFNNLGEWCKSRGGQIIVCENTKADWMDFKPIAKLVGSNSTTTEAMWCNEWTIFDNEQIKLF